VNAPDRLTAAADAIERTMAQGLNAVLAYERETVVRQVHRDISGPLAGRAIGIKDNICTLEYPTTCASRILAGYQSPYEATAVERIKAAGGIIACKTNLDEFAMGSSTEHSAFGPTRHPHFPDRVPGGSSGGSAALVASGAVDVALGSETGGSVRQPAAFCGIVGFKPSYGRVSRFGLVAFGSSLDQIAVFGRRVQDVIDVVEVITGHDPNDSTSLAEPPLDVGRPPADLDGVVVGLPVECFPDDLDADVRAACDRAADAMRAGGARLRPVSLPHTELAVATYYVIAPAEASANLARYDGVRYGQRRGADAGREAMYRATRGAGFGPEVQRRILIGTYVLSAGYYEAYYGRAQATRARIAADYRHVFANGVDLLLTPTTPGPAFRMGEHVHDPVAMYRADQFVCGANLAGLPAVSVPAGATGAGLPLGVQLIGSVGADARVLSAAALLASHVAGGQLQ